MNNPTTFNPIEAAKAQKNYCDTHECPLFAPSNGWCYSCGRNIYEPYAVRRGTETINLGIDVESAGKRLITSCPHCNTTFVD